MTDPEPVNLYALSDLTTPWCLRAAVTLHIPELIERGVDQIDALASAAGCDAPVLHAVLGHLASRGVFAEPSPGRFALNDAARQLLDPAMRIMLDLDGLGGRFSHIYSSLLDYVRTGRSVYAEQFGLPFFEDLAAHPRFAAAFDEIIGPAGHGTPDPVFNLTGGWESIRTVTDVGGGTGAFLAEMLRGHPHLRGTLVDLPETVARSAGIFAQAGVSERAATVGQSFFDPLPPGADLYTLRGILNDWPDREAEAILARCAEACRPGVRVVVLKSVGPDDTPKDLYIEMLLLGGRHRTLSEFAPMARRCGLEVIATGQQPSGPHYVECKPVP